MDEPREPIGLGDGLDARGVREKRQGCTSGSG